jgi:hypothetical protein
VRAEPPAQRDRPAGARALAVRGTVRPTDPAPAGRGVQLIENPVKVSRRTWTVTDLAATVVDDAPDREMEPALPDMAGSAKQRVWARELRYRFVTDRWRSQIPPSVRERLVHLTDARWWIDNREDLDTAMADEAEARLAPPDPWSP